MVRPQVGALAGIPGAVPEELQGNPALEDLRERIAAGTVTLLYGSRNRDFNHAAVLADVLRNGI